MKGWGHTITVWETGKSLITLPPLWLVISVILLEVISESPYLS
jgi:hypothetical protein